LLSPAPRKRFLRLREHAFRLQIAPSNFGPLEEGKAMSLSMYQASVPLFVTMLTNLTAILEKAEAFAKERNIDEDILLNWRLAPDMFPLTRQVQIAADFAKGAAARLAGAAMPSYADEETSLAELKQRIAKTLALIKSFKPGDIDGSEERDITLSLGGQEMHFKGQPYLLHLVIPNFFFHTTTAYDLLRACGVQIGKRDFIGAI
jgi:hypothetical protein